MKSDLRQLLRYGVVGVVSNAILYLSYLALTFGGVEHKVAMTLVYIVGASIGFVANRKWTFRHSGNITRAAIGYLLAQLAGYLLNLLILIIFVDWLGYQHQWVQAAGIIAVALFLFFALKYIVFNKLEK